MKYNQRLLAESDTLEVAKDLASVIHPGTVIFLLGELGSGKTTFARGFLRGLGYRGKVKSPTYTLVESYDMAICTLFHFDLYRLNQPQELQQMGIEEYFSPIFITLIEWPEKGGTYLPTPDVICRLSYEGMGRHIEIDSHTKNGEAVIANFVSCHEHK